MNRYRETRCNINIKMSTTHICLFYLERNVSWLSKLRCHSKLTQVIDLFTYHVCRVHGSMAMLPERDGQRRAVLYGGIEVSSQVIQVCIQKYKGRCQVKIS